MKLKPPKNGLEYNGTKATADGVEVAAADVDALKAAGWTAAAPARSQKTDTIPATPEEPADEAPAENED